MKISAIRIFRFSFKHPWLLLAAVTDTGITGWGDMSDACLSDSLARTLEERKNLLIGMDPLKMDACRQVISGLRRPPMSVVRSVSILESALDQALWDITGKHYGLPLYKLYGADGKNVVPLYGNLNNAIWDKRRPEDLRDQGLKAKKAGFDLVKCTPFDEVKYGDTMYSLEKAMDRIRALTEVYPIGKIAIDCHQVFDRRGAAVMAERVLTEFGNPFWIEDPVPLLDHETVPAMKVSFPGIRWASGEDSFSPADLMRTTAADGYDVLMPDIKIVGGPGAICGMAAAIRGMGKAVTLHNPSGIIATAHSAHVTAACRSLPLEFPVGAVADRGLLSVPEEPVRDGAYHLSDESGIGISLKKSAFDEFASEWIGGKWVKAENLQIC